MNNNPFVKVLPPENKDGSGTALAKPQNIGQAEVMARAISETQAAIIIAKQFPRDQLEATDRILTACQRPTLAENALYSYARGGTDITGPSIRLAEAIAQNWGNFQFGVRELEQKDGESTVEAYAWDVENNTRQVKIFKVQHVRHTKSGSRKLEDPRDIYETVANQGARRMRACILGLIPGDVIEAAVSQCEETMKAEAKTTPEALAKLVEAFAKYSVSKEQIEKRIQRRLDTITPAQLVGLRKIYSSMRDGMSTAAEWFELPAEQQKPGTEGLKAKVAARMAAGDKPYTNAPDPADLAERSGMMAESEFYDPAPGVPTELVP